jgi:F-type H+-transporting ATPase subunit epsilon
MANKILLEVVTPDKFLLHKDVDVVVATSVEGEFGVLAGHAPLLAALAIGEMRYRDGNALEYAAVAGGFCEVTGENVTILAESAELAREIDYARAKRARERAEQRLAKVFQPEQIDYARAEAALQRARVRMRVAERIRV